MKRCPALLLLLIALGCRTAPPHAPPPAGLVARYEDALARKQMAGAVTLVARDGRTPMLGVFGHRDLEAKDPMKADTIFQIASMTKPVTALAVMMLAEEGKLSIEDPVARILPDFEAQARLPMKDGSRPARPITVKDLLTHTSGLPGGMPPGFTDLYAKRHRTLEELAPALAQRPLDFQPGTKWAYCNAGIDLLGRIVEVRSGRRFEDFLKDRLFGPLGMTDTFFYPEPGHRDRIARIYKKKPDGIAPVDSFIGTAEGGRFPLPAGGLYSTAPDLLKLYRMLLDGGEAGGRRYLSKAVLDTMTRNHTGDLKAGFTDGIGMGLGFQVVARPVGVTETLSPGTYGHGGAFGTQGWIDPVTRTIFILMVQRSDFGNGDASDLRRDLQAESIAALR